jgi:hypothetical protein
MPLSETKARPLFAFIGMTSWLAPESSFHTVQVSGRSAAPLYEAMMLTQRSQANSVAVINRRHKRKAP